MAQDFYAGFSLGNDDRHIMTVDAEGVALAAIQGLHAMLEERMSEKDAKIEAQQQAIAEQQREVDELRERLSRVESLRSELDAVKRALPQLESGGK
jgi:septal ring factor EnvC (AmiA/AmiB activator)